MRRSNPSVEAGLNAKVPCASSSSVATYCPLGSTEATNSNGAAPEIVPVGAADVHPGSLLADGYWSIVPTIDEATGQIGIALSSDTPISSTSAGSLVTVDLTN